MRFRFIWRGQLYLATREEMQKLFIDAKKRS